MTTFKLIKSKTFDTNGVKGTTHTIAYKGRAMNLSTLSFADEDKDVIKLSEDKKSLIIDTKISIVQKPYLNDLGETVMGLSVMPKFDLDVDTF